MVLHRSVLTAFGRGESGALIALDDAETAARAVLIPMLGYGAAYRAADARAGEYLDALLEFGIAVDADLDRTAARGLALTADYGDQATVAALADAEAVWHARRRGWPVRATGEHADRLTAAHPDITVIPI
jgi:hypothetical protein